MSNRNFIYYPAYLGEKAQYLARESNDCTIRFALFYQGLINADLLYQATVELIERIDILHSSFQAAQYKAKWKVNTDYDTKEAFSFHQVETDISQKVNEVMLHSIEFDGKMQIHCSLISNNRKSSVVLSVGHMCADGKDAQYLLEKLIELYNCLLVHGDLKSVSLKNGTRNPKQCYDNLTLKNRIGLYSRTPSKNKTEYVYTDTTGGTPRIMHRTLSAELMASARKKGKEYHASINDLLLTAFYRATAKQLAITQGMGIQSMIDLRRRMPNGDTLGVCNLSGSMPTELKEGVKGDFSDTLKEIVEQTEKVKKDPLAGLYDFPIMSTVFRVLSFSMIQKLGAKVYGRATMGLTNLGALNGEKFAINGAIPCKAIFGAPLKQKPAFQLAVLGLNGDICISSTAVCTERDAKVINELLEKIQLELEGFC